MTPLFLNIAFGLILGFAWGGLSGLLRSKGFMPSGDPGTALMRNGISGIAGYLVAYLILGAAGAAAFGFIGLCAGIVPMVIVENFLRRRLRG